MSVTPGLPGTQLILLYRRAGGLNTEIDPRENALRVDSRWLLHPGMVFGFGRAPAGVDLAATLLTPEGSLEPSMPRLAGRISQAGGGWAVTNCSTTATKLLLTAPGLHREITPFSPPELLPRSRQWLTLRSPDGDVEHRFQLIVQLVAPCRTPISPGVRSEPSGPGDDAASPVTAVAPAVGVIAGTAATTTAAAPDPDWSAGDVRTLAAYCYPELRGLPPRSRDRTHQTLRLLDRPSDQTNEEWLERQLVRLRRDAGQRIGVDLHGEHHTPVFVNYVVEHRMLLGSALSSLEDRFMAARGAVERPE
ncbi:hypothetical protein CcI49_26850 [Frankia sp. CcI49]|uniref:hypothetical protein n=1 Tax=Frankia sp. CcI49 TaxID=1745382 RepID=UPI0009761F03|nr:hypothetical protein [Frankia sp. CcI49]ONH57044.1 hypothetical protein CcI49_26850 [Frankia sp. CcI49]